ncbi:Inositol-1-monophosphatase [Planctomycetes bacterium Pan216]|uniref:Inositol-1-monophosphatase n=1 Tax=Kolteria novifilia TaxID=2527975 RepID=A0A518B5S1_9BACT|nr:Inositol-1-monophosphatase [Planctomycetes bacterium Pan216]
MLNWQTERDVAIQAAKRAGDRVFESAGRIVTEHKGINDLVTQADRDAQEIIQETIGRRFPQDAFQAEENGLEERPSGNRRWIVDPIDGTTNFVHGFPFFCVSIGFEAEGELVAGVIYDPSRRECYSAAKGQGAVCNGMPLHVSATQNLSEALVAFGFPTDTSSKPDFMTRFGRAVPRIRSMRRLGSAAMALAYVAAGKLDAFWAENLKAWDAAAGVVLVREAGGLVTKSDGATYDVDSPLLLASNGLTHAPLASAIAS